MIFLEIYPLTKVFDQYTQVCQICMVELYTIVILSKGKKTSPNLDMLAEIYGLQTIKVICGYYCTWLVLGSS